MEKGNRQVDIEVGGRAVGDAERHLVRIELDRVPRHSKQRLPRCRRADDKRARVVELVDLLAVERVKRYVLVAQVDVQSARTERRRPLEEELSENRRDPHEGAALLIVLVG